VSKEERRMQDRFASTVTIAAAIIAAVRLAREDISTPSPRVKMHDTTIEPMTAESVGWLSS